MDRVEVYKLIDGERDYQDKKWGNLDTINSVGDFLNYMRNELNYAGAGYHGADHPEEALRHIRKLAGVCVACMEHHKTEPRQ